MSWDNQGKKAQDGKAGNQTIEDRASFDFNDEEQIHMCFHWTNYQPLWSADNNKKSDSYNPDTFEYKWSEEKFDAKNIRLIIYLFYIFNCLQEYLPFCFQNHIYY